MNLLLIREWDNGKDTIGKLYYRDNKVIKYIYSLEDEYRKDKVHGDTRISEGKYEIKLRKEGKTYDAYCKHSNKIIAGLTKKYGILWLQDVPNFKYILIHIGNKEDDTEGCILVGDSANNNSERKGLISRSTEAYIKLISAVLPLFDLKEKVFITIVDNDRNIAQLMKK